jgi:hypothetical protein
MQLIVEMPLVIPIVFVDFVHSLCKVPPLRGDCAGDVVVV